MTYVEKVQLVRVSSADARCEKQQITLQPRNLVAGKLKANTRSCLLAHNDCDNMGTECNAIVNLWYTELRYVSFEKFEV